MRWTQYDIDSLENRDPAFFKKLSEVAGPVLWRYFKPVVRGFEKIPKEGALYVGNHNGGFLPLDTFIFAIAVFRECGPDEIPYWLGHEIAIRMPVVHQISVPGGAVRASHENAHRLFAKGKKIMVYPGGDLDAMRSFRQRNRIVFGQRRGYIQLALKEKVPIVPVVAAGAHSMFVVIHDGRWLAKALKLDRLLRMKVWPITFSLPWGITPFPPPVYLPLPTRMYIEILDPISFDPVGESAASDRAYVEQCHHNVHSTMETALKRLAAERKRASSKIRGLFC